MSTFLIRYRTALLAVALNLSGTGAGYLFLRVWWLAAVHWLGLLVWWFAARSETGWLFALLGWVGLSVVVAGVVGARRAEDRTLDRRGPTVVAAATAVALLAGVLVGAGAYRGAAAETFQGAVAAHADGRCAEALDLLEDVDVDGALRRGFAATPEEVDAETQACTWLRDARALPQDDRADLATAIAWYGFYLASSHARFAGAADERAETRLVHADALADDGDRTRALEELTVVSRSGLAAAEEVPAHVKEMFRNSLSEHEGNPCAAIKTLDWYAARSDVPVAEDVAVTATGRLPAKLYDCARKRFAAAKADAKAHPRGYDAGTFTAARNAARRVTQEFPGSKQAGPARTLAERISEAKATAHQRKRVADREARERARRQAIIDDIEQTEGGKLPPPTASGSSGSGSSLVVVENGTSEQLEVLWTGPTTGKATIPPGSGGRCLSGSGPTRTITLGPGTYTMVVRAVTDSGVVPYKGSWNMSAGTRYDECYYIETTFGY